MGTSTEGEFGVQQKVDGGGFHQEIVSNGVRGKDVETFPMDSFDQVVIREMKMRVMGGLGTFPGFPFIIKMYNQLVIYS